MRQKSFTQILIILVIVILGVVGFSVVPTPSSKFAPFFEKITITLSNNSKIENYYTSSWFWCGGSDGQRVLDSTYSRYLDWVGETSQGDDAYILKENTPYPKNDHFVPSIKKSMNYEEENGQPVSQENWSNFISNQKNDYPLIIIKNSFGKMIMYFRQDYLYLPGC